MQIFITGSAHAAKGSDETLSGVPMHTYEAEAHVGVFRSDTGQVMANVAGEATRGVQRVALMPPSRPWTSRPSG